MPAIQSTSDSIPRQELLGVLMAAGLPLIGVADAILPPFSVMQDNGVYFVAPTATILQRGESQARGTGAGYKRFDTRLEQATYACKDYGNEKVLDDAQASNYAKYFDYEAAEADMVTRLTVLEREIRVKNLVHNETTFPASGTTGLTVSNAWSSAANGTPISDVHAGIAALHAKTGANRFKLQISYQAQFDLSRNNQIREALKYTQSMPGLIPLADLARALGVAEVVAPQSAMYNSADEGQTASLSEVWSTTYAFLYVAPATSSLNETCLGRTFVNDNDGGIMTVEQYRDERNRSNVLRARQKVHESLHLTSCGFLFKSVA